jgi:hypothetical protein
MDIWVPAAALRAGIATGASHVSLPGNLSAIVLLALLSRSMIRKIGKRGRPTPP